jgi:hypothetical protein
LRLPNFSGDLQQSVSADFFVVFFAELGGKNLVICLAIGDLNGEAVMKNDFSFLYKY